MGWPPLDSHDNKWIRWRSADLVMPRHVVCHVARVLLGSDDGIGCSAGERLLLPFVTQLDHPNGGHLTPERVT